MNKILILAKREFFQTVKKKSFWLSTLAFPILMIVIILISGLSSASADELFKPIDKLENGEKILILDETKLIDSKLLPQGFEKIRSLELGKSEVMNNEKVLAFFYYPEKVLNEKDGAIEIYLKNLSPLENNKYNVTATLLLKNTILSKLPGEQVKLVAAEIPVNVTPFGKTGEQVDTRVGNYLVPGLALFIYFLLISFGTSYMLSSVSEEKESRMIEILLSSLKPYEIIAGKLIGLFGVVVTQVTLLISLGLLIASVAKQNLPFDLGSVNVDPLQLIVAIFFIIFGFLLMACIMVGVGAAMPTLKEAQGFSSIFIMIAILPVYFITAIATNPDGTIAKVTSYIPITSPIVILFRNALTNLSLIEIVIAGAMLLIEVLIAFWIGLKLFKLGSLEYSNKINLRNILR